MESVVGAAEELNEFLDLISKGEQLKVTYSMEDRETQWFSMWGKREGILFKSFMCVKPKQTVGKLKLLKLTSHQF